MRKSRLGRELQIVPVARKHMSEVITLLQEISHFVPDLSTHDEIWERFSAQENVFSVVALDGQIVVGYGSMVLESKIRGGLLAHIEDIVTDPGFRGMGIGREIVLSLIEIATTQGCYKVALHCAEKNLEFYRKSGLSVAGNSMQLLLTGG
jgi:glucosamine-phosphate N-acetyltransferase